MRLHPRSVRTLEDDPFVARSTSTQRRPLVQWISRNTAPHGRDIDPDSPIGAIATSVVGAEHLRSTLAEARKDGRGVLVDTEAWREQLEPDDPQRAGEFRRLGLGLDHHHRLVPSRDVLSRADRSHLLAVHRNAQVAAGATILLSPYHRVREEAPLGRGRRLDVTLAHEFAALAATTGATQPRSGEPSRSVAIGIAVDAKKLGPAVIAELIAAYREVRADLFWIWVWEFTSSAAQYKRVHALASGLQAASETPCLLGGIGRLWEAALRNEVAAACQGWGRARMPFPPPAPPQAVNKDEDRPGWGVHVFHPAIRGTTGLGREAEEPLRRLFAELPCRCGHHAEGEVPESQRDRHAHNRACAEELMAEIAELGSDRARDDLTGILAEAEDHRSRLELRKLERGWHAAIQTPPASVRFGLHCQSISGSAA